MGKNNFSNKPESKFSVDEFNHWDDARIFLAVARLGTLSKAAETLHLGVATVSRRIERLEKTMNVHLFNRQQSGYQLTEAGNALMAAAENIEQAARVFAGVAEKQNEIAGRVRLATAENLANVLIIPALKQFGQTYPGIKVDIISGINVLNLHQLEADIAIRMVRPEQGNLLIRKLGKLGYGLYASIEYSDKHQLKKGRKSVKPDYQKLDFIGWTEPFVQLPAAVWMKQNISADNINLKTSSLAGQLSAVLAGFGLAVLPHIMTNGHPLICLQNIIEAEQEIWLVMNADIASAKRVRLVADFLTELIHDNEKLLAERQHSFHN